MFKILLSALLLGSVFIRLFAETYLYVGICKKKYMPVFVLNEKDGTLKHIKDIALDKIPGFLAYNEKVRKIYAISGRTSEIMTLSPKADGNAVFDAAIDIERGACFLGLDKERKFIFAANYGKGKIFVYKINEKAFPDPTPIQEIKTEPRAHSVIFDRNERFLYAPHTAPNKIFQFAFNSKTGALTPLKPEAVAAPKDAEPRHAALHPKLNIFYVSNERNMTVSAYKQDPVSGQLSLLQTIPTLTEKFTGKATCSDIKITPDGKFLFVANRGPDSIACIALDKNGKMKMTKTVKTGKIPRYILVDPSGRFLYSACMGSNDLWAYKIDKETGVLKENGIHPLGAPGFGLIIVK
jgi:6-phosphogluconolactonase